VYASFRLSKPLLGDFRSNDVTSGSLPFTWGHGCQFLSPDCLHREQQPCRKWNVQYTPVFGLLHPLQGALRRNDVTSGSLPVTWDHVTSFPVTWLPSRACYSLVRREMYSIRVFGFLQPLPGYFRSNDVTSGSLQVTWGHMTSVPVTWLPFPASYSLVGNEMYFIRQCSAFYSNFQVTSGQMTSLPGHFRSPEVTCRHFLSRDHLLVLSTAL